MTTKGPLGISDGLKGKMKGMNALSTSPHLNPNCQKNSKISNSICEKCYAIKTPWKNLRNMLANNTKLLTENLLDMGELPVINSVYFRFESHGDLNNAIQLRNYINIAKKNPNTRFTLWTKQYLLAEHVFEKYGKPSNFTAIYSSLKINKRIDINRFKHADKIFTVYSKDTKESINCGGKDCMGCLTCYKPTRVKYIKEVIK
jgi:hypothetical protein